MSLARHAQPGTNAHIPMLKNLKQLLHLAAYHPEEIERVLDPKQKCFLKFHPILGYEMKNYAFHDGSEKTLCDYHYEKRGGHRRVIHGRGQPCRINTYGDSYTQCAQVNDGETWQEILAAHFLEPIRNFGVGGYGVYHAWRRALLTETQKDLAAKYATWTPPAGSASRGCAATYPAAAARRATPSTASPGRTFALT